MVQDGLRYYVPTLGNLSTTSGAVVPCIYPRKHSKALHTHAVDLCNGM
jgi:hypothetical protein